MPNFKYLRGMVLDVPTVINLAASGNVLEADGVQVNSATASKPAKLNASKQLISGDIDLTSEVTGQLPYANMDISDGDLTIAKTSGLQTALDAKQATSAKGANNGYAGLDGGGKVPAAQLPASLMAYKGTWAASTNTPTLADGTGDAGDVYVASDAGTVDFGAGNIVFLAGDWVIYSGSIWEKSVNSNAVASVNTQTGAVVLDTDDISEGTNKYFSAALAKSAAVADSITDAVTDVAPSQNAVFDALAGKSASGHDHDGDYSALSHGHTASDVSDFTTAARTAAVLNTTAGSETDQAASVSAMKAYVQSELAAGSSKVGYASLLAGESFAANKTFFVRWALTGETAGRVYLASKQPQDGSAPTKQYAVGVIQTTAALSAGDSIVGDMVKVGKINLKSGDALLAVADQGKPLFLQEAGVASKTLPGSGVTSGYTYAVVIVAQIVEGHASVPASCVIDVACASPAHHGNNIAA